MTELHGSVAEGDICAIGSRLEISFGCEKVHNARAECDYWLNQLRNAPQLQRNEKKNGKDRREMIA